jgi:hypothetical protein
MKTRFLNQKFGRIRSQICWECNQFYGTTQPWSKYCSDECAAKGAKAAKRRRKSQDRRYDAQRDKTPERKEYNRLKQAARRKRAASPK